MNTTATADLATATPLQIDTALAALHHEAAAASVKIEQLTNRVLDHAGLRQYVAATWQNRKAGYKVLGTFEEAVERLAAYDAAFEAWRAADYPADLRPAPLSNYSGRLDVAEVVRDREAAIAHRHEVWTEINAHEAEYARRPWARFFIVTSSAGHVHRDMHCHTCRPTTTYGWLPDLSGKDDATAVGELGAVLCTACYPDAPVERTGGKITKAQAAKLAA